MVTQPWAVAGSEQGLRLELPHEVARTGRSRAACSGRLAWQAWQEGSDMHARQDWPGLAGIGRDWPPMARAYPFRGAVRSSTAGPKTPNMSRMSASAHQ